MTSNDIHYKTLGLSLNASPAEIRKQYLLLVRKYHPDKSQNADTTSIFVDIQRAYNILCGREEEVKENDKTTVFYNPSTKKSRRTPNSKTSTTTTTTKTPVVQPSPVPTNPFLHHKRKSNETTTTGPSSPSAKRSRNGPTTTTIPSPFTSFLQSPPSQQQTTMPSSTTPSTTTTTPPSFLNDEKVIWINMQEYYFGCTKVIHDPNTQQVTVVHLPPGVPNSEVTTESGIIKHVKILPDPFFFFHEGRLGVRIRVSLSEFIGVTEIVRRHLNGNPIRLSHKEVVDDYGRLRLFLERPNEGFPFAVDRSLIIHLDLIIPTLSKDCKQDLRPILARYHL